MKEPINFGWENRTFNVPRKSITEILFHRERMLLLDYVLISYGEASSEFTIPAENCEGHEPMPGMPVFPGVMITEMAKQLLGVILATNPVLEPIMKGRLWSAREDLGTKFNDPVFPGDKLVLTTKTTDIDIREFSGVVIVKSGRMVAEVGGKQKAVVKGVVISGVNLSAIKTQ